MNVNQVSMHLHLVPTLRAFLYKIHYVNCFYFYIKSSKRYAHVIYDNTMVFNKLSYCLSFHRS